MIGIEALHLGAVVYVKDVEPMPGTEGRTKTRPGILLRKCLGSDDMFPVVIVKTIRGDLSPHEIQIPTKADGSGPTSLSNPSAVVCNWIVAATVGRIERKVGKCPVPVTAAIAAKVQELSRLKAVDSVNRVTAPDANHKGAEPPTANMDDGQPE